MKPLIGILPLYDTKKESLWMLPGYMDGVAAAGGLPFMLSLRATQGDIAQIAALCSGFVFTGGQDVAPALYGQHPAPWCGETFPARDALEGRLLTHALRLDKPVLAICRGLQFLNVFLGGTLYQDIEAEYTARRPLRHHQPKPYEIPCHAAHILPGTPLAGLLQKREIQVNSCHHQAIKTLGRGLRAMASAPDGIVEAVCLPGRRYVRAYQWHPEYMYPRDENQRALFEDFVAACRAV